MNILHASTIDQFQGRLKKKVKTIESDMKYSFVRHSMAIKSLERRKKHNVVEISTK